MLGRTEFQDADFKKLIAPPACPWVLVTTSAGADSSRFALELTTADATADAGAPLATQPAGATVWVTVMSFEFETRKPDGKPWDFGGGAPDPVIWIKTTTGTKLTIVPMMKDTFKAMPMMRAPAAVEVTPTSPLEIGATDIDEVSDDPMGRAFVTLADVLAGKDLEVETRLNGTRTGVIRIKVDVAR
jgi:hypothetical protein